MAPGGTKRSASPPSAPKPKKQRQGASSGSAGSSSRPEPAVSQVDVGDQPQSAGSQAEIGGQPQLAVSQAEAPKLGRPGEDNLVVRDDAYVLSVRQGLSGADAVCFDRLHKPIADYFDRRHCLQEDQRRQLNGIEPEVLTTILLSGMEPGSRATFGGELTPGLARRVLDATSPFQGGDTNIGIYVIILLPKPGRRGHVHVYVGSAGGPKGFEGRITQHLSERFRAGEPGKMLYKQIARGTHDIKAHVVISLPFTFVVKYGRIFLRFAESAIVSILSSYHIIMASKADMVTEEPLSPLGHLTLKRQQEKLGHYGLNFSVPWLELGREQPVGRLFSEGFSQVIGSEHKTDKSRLFWNITMCFSADGSRQHLHVPAKVKRDLAVCPLGDGSKLTARVFVLGERSPPGTAHEHAWVDLPDEPRYRDARRIAIGLTAFDRDQPNQLKTVWLKNAWRRRNDTKAAAYIHSLWLTSIGQLPLPVPVSIYPSRQINYLPTLALS